MKLAIMQPYFMPYIGYFSLIKHVDNFILFDVPQFIRHGWIERNRILKQNGESLYIKVPLKKHSRNTKIIDIEINDTINWREKIKAQLVIYKKHAPYYSEVCALLNRVFTLETTSIVELNQLALTEVCEYLGIQTPISVWSKMGIEIENVNAPDEWALNICVAMGANTYYNPPGGRSFFDKAKYDKASISLQFMTVNETMYSQFSNEFVPFLSIVDVLMFNSVDEVNFMLDNYSLD